MATEKRLIDANECYELADHCYSSFYHHVADLPILRNLLNNCPTVDAVEVPCRPGDHVFRLCGTKKHRYVGERIVSAVTLCGNGSWRIHSTADDALGKTVFLTREEAEAALAKMGGERKDND